MFCFSFTKKQSESHKNNPKHGDLLPKNSVLIFCLFYINPLCLYLRNNFQALFMPSFKDLAVVTKTYESYRY